MFRRKPINIPIPTPLHSAVFNGRNDKFAEIIDAGVNIYELTANNESMLALAMYRNHPDIASILLDSYEQDFYAMQKFFFEQNCENYFWILEIILVAYEDSDISFVKDAVSSHKLMMVTPDTFELKKNGLIILLKATGASCPEILWIVSKKPGDDRVIAKIIKRIYSNGVVGAARKDHQGRSLMEIASDQRLYDIFFRLEQLFGQHYLTQNKYLELLCRLSQNTENEVDCFKSLMLRLNKFKLHDVLTANDNKNYEILNYPLVRNQIALFEYILEELAIIRAAETFETVNDCIRYILNYFLVYSADIFERSVPTDFSGLAEVCVRRKAYLLTENKSKQPILHALVQDRQQCITLSNYILENMMKIIERGYMDELLKRLINKNWVDVIKILFAKSRAIPSRFFYNHSTAIDMICSCISDFDNEMAVFLIDQHQNSLTMTDCTRLLINSSLAIRSTDVLVKLLSLPISDPINCCKFDDYYYHSSPIYSALQSRKLSIYRLLCDAAAKDPSAIAGIKDGKDGNNLLAAAIWWKREQGREIPFHDYIYKVEDQTLEIIDHMDDDQEIQRKRAYNKRILIRYHGHQSEESDLFDNYTAKSLAQEETDLNTIFDHLISIGCNYNHVNDHGHNLIHLALRYNNLHILKKLIDLGVDPNQSDNNEMRPIHKVNSIEAYDLLMLHIPVDALTQRDIFGQTPLHCSPGSILKRNLVILPAMLAAGADPNAVDNEGNTALHVAPHPILVEALLAHGADLNAQNNAGETAAHRALLPERKPDLLKTLYANENLNLNLITKTGVSLLPGLIGMSDNDFNDILPNLLKRGNALDRLFLEHSNSIDHFGVTELQDVWYEQSSNYCLERVVEAIKNSPEAPMSNNVALAALHDVHKLKRVLKLGASIGVRTAWSPVIYAIGNKFRRIASRVESLELLVERGAAVDVVDYRGRSALEYAIKLGDSMEAIMIIATLIGGGAKYRQFQTVLFAEFPIFKCILT